MATRRPIPEAPAARLDGTRVPLEGNAPSIDDAHRVQAAFAERGPKAGEIVCCGTCTGMLPIDAGEVLEADFGALGHVSAALVRALSPPP